MPIFEHNSTTTRFDVGELIACAFAPVGNDDLTRKAYVDAIVGGLGYYMSQYATPQAAVDAAIASGYKMVFVDDLFAITVPLDLTAAGAVNFTLLGMGQDAGFIVNDAAATGAISIGQNDVTIQNLHIDVTNCVAAAIIIATTGERTRLRNIDIIMGAGITAATGIHLDTGSSHKLEGIRIIATGATMTTGLLIDSDSHRDKIHLCDLYDMSIGANVSGDYSNFAKCTFSDTGSYPIRFQPASLGSSTEGCYFINAGSNLYCQGDDLIILNNYFVNATGTAIRFSPGQNRGKIIGNNITTAGARGIDLDGNCYASVVGNVITGTGGNAINLESSSDRNVVSANIEHACNDGVVIDNSCSYNLIVGNQVPDGLTMGTDPTNEDYHNIR